jgi:hypothetical protein
MGYTEKLIERPGTGKVVFHSYVLRKTEKEGLVRIEGIYWRPLSENISLISSRR